MKIVSFNINGIKSFTEYIKIKYSKDLNSYLKDILEVDIACFQEIKTTTNNIETFSSLKDYMTFTSLNKLKNGIYGVSTFVNKKLYCKKHNINVPFLDDGRAILTDHGTFKVLNLYFPFFDENGKKTRDEIIYFYDTIKSFIDQFDDLVVCGDFNAVYSPYDHYQYIKEYFRMSESVREDKIKIKNQLVSDKYTQKIIEIISNNLKTKDIINKNTIIQDINDRKCCGPINNDFNSLLNNFKAIYTPDKSKYLDFIYDSIKDIDCVQSEVKDSPFLVFREDLIEKRYVSKTELPYLINSREQLLGVLLSTYQRFWLLKFILEFNYIDVFRMFCAEYHRYTCWNTQLNLRPSNQGTRIDYIFVSIKFLPFVKGAGIHPNVYGSDHCPTFLIFNLQAEGDEPNLLKIKNNLLGFLKR